MVNDDFFNKRKNMNHGKGSATEPSCNIKRITEKPKGKPIFILSNFLKDSKSDILLNPRKIKIKKGELTIPNLRKCSTRPPKFLLPIAKEYISEINKTL